MPAGHMLAEHGNLNHGHLCVACGWTGELRHARHRHCSAPPRACCPLSKSCQLLTGGAELLTCEHQLFGKSISPTPLGFPTAMGIFTSHGCSLLDGDNMCPNSLEQRIPTSELCLETAHLTPKQRKLQRSRGWCFQAGFRGLLDLDRLHGGR